MADESKLSKEIIDLDAEEQKVIDFVFTEDLDTGTALTGTPLITTSDGLTLTLKSTSSDRAQVLLNSGATPGLYVVKCIATDDGSTTQTYVGRGRVRVS